MPHDPKFFQRSLSERLPDRDQNKLDSMFDQRYGLQNHIRDMNRFSAHSFEPFSPSRFHETMRSLDFKEMDNKLFDPTGEKFQRMAENFNEFRSRFQDQMFQMNRRDGLRGNGMPSFENRNMINEMNDRNSYFNSRNDIGLSSRDKYINNNRGFGSMNGNDLDSYSANRSDDLRAHSRNNVSMSSPNPSIGEYPRPNDGPNEDINMQMDDRRDIRGPNMRLDQGMSMRLGSDSDMMMNRSRGLTMNVSSDHRLNSRSEMLGDRENEMASMNHRNGLEMGMGSGRLMMQHLSNGKDLMNDRNSLIRQGSDMMNGSNERMTSRREMDLVDGNSVSLDKEHDRRVTQQQQQRQDLGKSGRDLDILNGNDIRRNQTNDLGPVDRHSDLPMGQARDMALDDGIGMNDMSRNGRNDLRLQSRNEVQMDICNDLTMNGQENQYPDKQDMRLQNQNMILSRSDGNLSVHDELSMNRPSSIHHLAGQQNGGKPGRHDDMIPDDELDFVDGNENKRLSSSNPMTEAIRQRKRKPANPQHVFMPSIDHYTLGFQTDEVEDCGGLMLDVENGGNFERRLTTVDSRN